jgi:DNA-directed RNA polymerase specialized sigma24 family protein
LLTEEPQEGRAQKPAAAGVPRAEIGSGPQLRDHQREAVSAPEKSQADPKPSTGSSADERDLIERLEAEWPALASGALHGRLRDWSEHEPALAVFATPQHLQSHLRGLRGQHRAEDEILAALVRQAQTDPLAARVVLQALLPGLKALARRILLDASERDELWSALLAHCWERIRSYPLERRPARIAANTLLDTLKKTTHELKRYRRDRDQFTDDAPEQAALEPGDRDVERLVRRAIAAAAISEQEADLILRTRIDGVDLHALADEAGLAYHTVKVRRLRAEKRLLLFLGHSPVTFGGRKRPLSGARAVGDGLTGSAGRGAATHLNRRR